MTASILVLDDNPDLLIALSLLLRGAGHRVRTVETPAAARAAAAAEPFDILLTDMNFTRDTTSGDEGLALIAEFQPTGRPIIAMTAWGDIDLAVEAMRRGAADFLTKPFDNAHLLEKVAAHRLGHAGRERELAHARQVQRRLLPSAPPPVDGLAIDIRFEPAREVGGDYYDFFPIAPGRLAFVLADVSGKGIPAALMMANLQALFRAGDHTEPAQLLARVNRLFHAATTESCYATLFYGLLDLPAGLLLYANCGHPAAELDDRPLASNNTVIGMFPELAIEMTPAPLAGRRRLTVYSDGLTDEGDDLTVLTFTFPPG